MSWRLAGIRGRPGIEPWDQGIGCVTLFTSRLREEGKGGREGRREGRGKGERDNGGISRGLKGEMMGGKGNGKR